LKSWIRPCWLLGYKYEPWRGPHEMLLDVNVSPKKIKEKDTTNIY